MLGAGRHVVFSWLPPPSAPDMQDIGEHVAPLQGDSLHLVLFYGLANVKATPHSLLAVIVAVIVMVMIIVSSALQARRGLDATSDNFGIAHVSGIKSGLPTCRGGALVVILNEANLLQC